jgi:hypothetical protein
MMETGFEFEGCLQPCSGLAEALDAAGIDCSAPDPGADGDAGADADLPHLEVTRSTRHQQSPCERRHPILRMNFA